MIARRQFLQAATIAPAAMWLPAMSLGETLSTPRMIAIYDAQIPASNVFARNARRMGISILGTAGDVGALWHTTMLPMLKQKPRNLIGLTLPSDLFLLKSLATDAGMVVAHETVGHASANLIAWAIGDRAQDSGNYLANVCNALRPA
jgi:hypothetical protein